MIYSKEITVPPETSIDSPYEYKMPISKGIIHTVSLFLPWGCAGLCWVRIYYRTWPIFPLTREEWIRGNDIGFSLSTNIEVTEDNPEVIIQSYNEDDTFEHHPIIMLAMNKSTLNPMMVKLGNLLS